MPVSDWIPVLGAKDGTIGQTVIVPSGGEATINGFTLNKPFSTGDFPTAPSLIVGVEFRVSAYASHPGAAISRISAYSLWQQSSGSLGTSEIIGVSDAAAPPFDVGAAVDLLDAEWIAAGGFEYLARESEVVDAGPPSIPSTFTSPAYWHTTVSRTAIGEPGSPYVRDFDQFDVTVTSTEGYNVTLYVDAVDIRLHYYDASSVAMAGGGTISASLSKALKINTGLSGGGSIAATMNGMRNIAATLFGDGKVSPSLSRDDGSNVYRYIMPELSGSGSMALVPLIRYAPIAVDLECSGESSMTLLRGHGVKASAPVAMRFVGLMSQALRRQRVIARNLSGSGVISATVQKQQLIDTDLSGAGTVTIASGGVYATRPVAAAISGVGMVVSTLQRARIAETQNLIGTGIASATLLARRPIAAAMSGGGTVSALLTSNVRLEAPPGRTFNPPSDFQAFVPPDDFIVFQGD